MIINYYRLDPTENITLLVETPVPPGMRKKIAAKLMRAEPGAEQVGFVEGKTLNMAGGEFCGNATLSAAAVYCLDNGLDRAELDFNVSGTEKPVRVSIQKEGEDEYLGTVEMPSPVDIKEIDFTVGNETVTAPLIDFGGISHIILTGKTGIEECEKILPPLCQKLGADCLGIMLVDGEKLTPLVYVPSPETLVRESSCASGTAAAGIYFALKNGGSFSGEFTEPGGKLKIEVRPDNPDRDFSSTQIQNLTPRLTGKVKAIKRKCLDITL